MMQRMGKNVFAALFFGLFLASCTHSPSVNSPDESCISEADLLIQTIFLKEVKSSKGDGCLDENEWLWETTDSSLNRLWLAYKEGITGVTGPYNPKLRQILLRQADKGHPRVQLWVGFIYGRGLGVKRDLDLAEKWWSMSPLPEAKTALGTFYFLGKNQTDKAEQLLLSSLPSDPEAAPILIELYRRKKDSSRTLAFLKEQIHSGPYQGQFHRKLGQMYLNADGVPQDCAKAKRHLHQAADKFNDLKAQLVLGLAYGSKNGRPHCFAFSPKTAQHYLNKINLPSN